MSKYGSLFGDLGKCPCADVARGCKNPLAKNCEAAKQASSIPAQKTNLFGEAKSDNASLTKIESWRIGKDIKTSANRINFILGGIDVSKISSMQISDIGSHQVSEATEANRCVDRVVQEFAELKPHLEQPKTMLLGAIGAIEGGNQSPGFLSFFRRKEPTDWKVMHSKVKDGCDEALRLTKNCVKYRLNPFIEGLDAAKEVLNSIIEQLDNTINALNFVIDTVQDPLIQDLARRRKEMFAKSLALQQLNKGQIDTMTLSCEKNKAFEQELEMNIIPLIENVLRTAAIDDGQGQKSLNDISTKLKGIL